MIESNDCSRGAGNGSGGAVILVDSFKDLVLRCCVSQSKHSDTVSYNDESYFHDHRLCPRGEITIIQTNPVVGKRLRQIVVPSLPVALRMAVTNVNEATKHLREFIGDSKNVSLHVLLEYADVVVYNHADEWHTSTVTKLDAKRSLWGTDETKLRVGHAFELALKSHRKFSSVDQFHDTLDQMCVYRFAVTTPNQCRRIAKQGDEPKLYMLNKLDRVTMRPKEPVQRDAYLNEWSLPSCENLAQTNRFEYPFRDGHGVVCYNRDTDEKSCYVNSVYAHFDNVIGFTQSPYSAYVNNAFDESNLRDVRRLYPEYSERFDAYDECIKSVADDVYKHIYEVDYSQSTKAPRDVNDIANHVKHHYSTGEIGTDNVEHTRRNAILNIITTKYNKSKLNRAVRSRYMFNRRKLKQQSSNTNDTSCQREQIAIRLAGT